MTFHRDIVVVGASSGGLATLSELLLELPEDLNAAVFIMLHRAPSADRLEADFLPRMLQAKAKLPVLAAVAGQTVRGGTIYVAPRGAALTFEGDRIAIDYPPPPNPSRWTVNTLFRSAALAFGNRVIAVLLTGMLDDGSAGFWDVRRRGGITIVQDPAQAAFAAMPRAALNHVPVHYCLSIPEIASTLAGLTSTEFSESNPAARPRILIVEDEGIVAMHLARCLADLDYDVVGTVASAEEAMSLVATVSPDIILMDVQLAGTMRGTEAGRLIWQRFHVPIVYVTAYSDEKTIADAKASMPYGFVVKPYLPAQIQAALKLALDRFAHEMAPAGRRAGTRRAPATRRAPVESPKPRTARAARRS